MPNTTHYTQTGTYSQNILLQSTNPATDPTTLQAAQGVVATITGSITTKAGSGAQPLVISGPGTIVLANATGTPNSWSGGTTVDAGGTLSIDSFAEIGQSAFGSPLAILSDQSGAGTLTLTNTASSRATSASVGIGGGTGTIAVSDAASSDTIDSVSGTAGTFVKDGAGTLILSDEGTADNVATTIAAGTLEVQGTVAADVEDDAALVFAEPGQTTYAGALTGSGKVTVAANTLLVLTGSDAVTGGTTIAARSVVQVGDSGTATAGALSGPVTNGGTLDIVDGILNGATIKNRSGDHHRSQRRHGLCRFERGW